MFEYIHIYISYRTYGAYILNVSLAVYVTVLCVFNIVYIKIKSEEISLAFLDAHVKPNTLSMLDVSCSDGQLGFPFNTKQKHTNCTGLSSAHSSYVFL